MSKTIEQQGKEIENLKNLSDDEIDTSDIPEITDWSGFEVGKFYRPQKKQITIRLDADLLEWFRHSEVKYQTKINQVLRQYMQAHQKTG